MINETVKGLVIRTTDIKESDRLITIFTEEKGVVSALARGARSHKSRKMSSTLQFCYSNFVLYKQGEYYHVKEADLIESFLEDCELRPEAVTIYTSATGFRDLSLATHFYNRQLDDLDFNKDPFNASTRHFYVSYVQLLEVSYDREALRVFDIINKCNELTGGD